MPAGIDDRHHGGCHGAAGGRVSRPETIEFNVEGFGGTDFRLVFGHVDHQQLNPACLIHLTDADGVYPDEPSTFPTLWAITTPNRRVPCGGRQCTSMSQVHKDHPRTQGWQHPSGRPESAMEIILRVSADWSRNAQREPSSCVGGITRSGF